MTSKHDYGCEIISFIALFILSALSHFWYIMILVGMGGAVWLTCVLLARLFLYGRAAFFPEYGCQADRGNASAAMGMQNAVFETRASSASPNIRIVSQESH
jgi:hypothetical protein